MVSGETISLSPKRLNLVLGFTWANVAEKNGRKKGGSLQRVFNGLWDHLMGFYVGECDLRRWNFPGNKALTVLRKPHPGSYGRETAVWQYVSKHSVSQHSIFIGSSKGTDLISSTYLHPHVGSTGLHTNYGMFYMWHRYSKLKIHQLKQDISRALTYTENRRQSKGTFIHLRANRKQQHSNLNAADTKRDKSHRIA